MHQKNTAVQELRDLLSPHAVENKREREGFIETHLAEASQSGDNRGERGDMRPFPGSGREILERSPHDP